MKIKRVVALALVVIFAMSCFSVQLRKTRGTEWWRRLFLKRL